MERETKEIKTSKGHKAVIKTYLSFGEARKIQKVFLENVNIGLTSEGKTEFSSLDGSIAQKAENALIETLVVSVDGKKENILSLIEDLPSDDAQEIINELNKIQQPLTEEKKTK